jgi:hypothetical protein
LAETFACLEPTIAALVIFLSKQAIEIILASSLFHVPCKISVIKEIVGQSVPETPFRADFVAIQHTRMRLAQAQAKPRQIIRVPGHTCSSQEVTRKITE